MICKEYDEKIQKWIEENRDTMVSMWMELIRVPSVRSEPGPDAPFGEACAQALAKATGYGAAMGFETRLEAARGYGLVSYGQGEKTIGLFGHSDVVPAGDGWLLTEPFAPVLRDGVVIGRGCRDNKNGVLASLFAAKLLRECQIPLKSRLQIYIGSNEESGMGDLINFVANEKMPDISLIPDANYPCSLGEKGHLKQWNRCKTPLVDVLDFHGEGAFNIVLDYAYARLAYTPQRLAELTEKTRGQEAFTLSQTAEGDIMLTAKGASKHSAYPEGSVNAALLICALLADCTTLCDSDREQLGTVARLMDGYYGEAMGIGFQEPGFGKLTCTNGMVEVTDRLLSVAVDIRYGTGLDSEKLEQLLDEAWHSAGWETTYRDNHHGVKVDPNSPIPGLLTELACQLSGQEYKPYWMNGGTYCRHLKNGFTVGSRMADPNSKAVIPQLPAGHGGAHQRDEYCPVDEFLMGLRMLVHAILVCDEAINQ